jgi:poly(hydroxyalkanoate) depolymerase family esterase
MFGNEGFLKSMREALERMRTHGPAEATTLIQRALMGGGDTAEAGTPTVSPQADPTEPMSKSPGKRPPGSEPGSFSLHAFDGPTGRRDYKLYVPRSYAGQPVALIVMLHGCTQDANDFAAGTRMNEIAERDGFLVAYPIQSRRANASKCWNWFQPSDQKRGQGEPSIIDGITGEIMERYRVDPRRVYVAGLSAGGAMADVMIHVYPERYAAAGIHSGLPYGSATDLQSALAVMKGGRGRAHSAPAGGGDAPLRPIIVFQGTADSTVHASNSNALLGAFENGGTEVIDTVPASVAGRGYALRLLSASNGVSAEGWSIDGAAHAWAGGSSTGSYTDPQGPNASAEMVRFFLAHPRVD